jgi:hypothetical protein
MPSVKAKKSKKRARSAKPKAKAAKAAPHPAEVALAYLVKRTPRGSEVLARVLGKSPRGVELLLKSCDGAEGAPPAARAVKARVARLQEVLGEALRGQLSLDEAVWQPVKLVTLPQSEPVSAVPAAESDHGDLREDLERALVSSLTKPM